MLIGFEYPIFAEDELTEEDLAEGEANRENENLKKEQAIEADEMRVASSKTIRQFHEVLDELLAEFGYDIKTGQLNGLDNIAIRKVEVSEALPNSYEKYIKMLITERIRDNAQVRILNCISCETKTSKLVEGKIIITSPSTNVSELKFAAERLGIKNFMDIILVYHSTHMVLALQIFTVESNELIWTRTYNSETIKSRFQKLAIDYRQVAKSRPGEDYQPEYRILIGAGGSALPNIGGDENNSSMLALEVRSTERFNNRKSEFGMLLSIYSAISSILNDYPILEGTGSSSEETPPQPDFNAQDTTKPAEPQPFSTALAITALYAHNFLGSVESYNELRQGIHLAAGGLFAGGYLAGHVRLGWDMYFGRRFVVSFAGLYIAPSKILLEKEWIPTKGGNGAEVVVSYNY